MIFGYNLEFSGEFRDGSAWNGQGTFWSDQRFIFEGELRNGKPWNGKETSRFEPEQDREYREGVATLTTTIKERAEARAKLEAEVVTPDGPNWFIFENQPCQVYYPDPFPGMKVTWSGVCIYGKASGEGRMVFEGGGNTAIYIGRLHSGKLHGSGTMVRVGGDNKGHSYNGDWRDSKKHGRGAHTKPDGVRYEGDWRDGRAHGIGTSTSPNGGRYEGEFRDNKRHGRGTFTWPDGEIKNCEWRNNEVVKGTCR